MKSFQDFINEATIKGNLGVPGEGPEGRDEESFLRGVEEEGRRKAAGDPRQIGGRMWQMMQENKSLIRGKEKEIEKFAEDIIKSVYSGFMDNVELDLQIVRDGNDVKEFMDEEDEKKKERNEKEKQKKEKQKKEKQKEDKEPSVRKSDNVQLRLEIDKRKLANAITQGEAKNTKLIIQMPECLDGLKRILGDRDGSQLHRQLLEMTELADKMDWIIPVQAKADMMERMPEGMAGACSVDWKDEDEDESENEEKQDAAQNVLDELQNKDGDLNEMSEELEEIMSSGKPIIRARGVDFVMLIHEAVKGIYELITSRGIPEDEELASNVFLNTETFEDEAEDFRYGPPIAASLRDFINTNKKTDLYPNVREFVFGKMMEIPAEGFLPLMRGILKKTAEAREQIDRLIDEVIDELGDYETKLSDYEMSKRFEQEPEHEYASDEEETDLDKLIRQTLSKEEETPSTQKSYDEMTMSEIQSAIDNAVADENYELAHELTQKYLKGEAKKVWENELKRINESNHTRRNR